MSFTRMPRASREYANSLGRTVPGKSTSLWQSFAYAGRGVHQAFRTEINLRTHVLALVLVIGLGVGLDISLIQWALLILASGLVVACELINSAVEAFADAVHPTYHAGIAKAKDIAAGAVLVASFVALLVGILIFYTSLERLLGG